jgi:predicted esterase
MAFAEQRVLLGFSQGAAAAVRFFCASNVHFERLVLWAGSFPPDVGLPEFGKRFKSSQIDLVSGVNDDIVPPTVYDQLQRELETAGATVRLHHFEGKHDLHLPTLRKVLGIED